MAAPAPAPLQDLGPLVLGDDALDLKQQVVLRGAADRVVEEDHVGPGPPELLDQQDLVGIAAGQPVRRHDVDALDRSSGDRVAQALQRRAHQERAAVALVDIGVVRLQSPTVGRDPLAQDRHLSEDRVVALTPTCNVR